VHVSAAGAAVLVLGVSGVWDLRHLAKPFGLRGNRFSTRAKQNLHNDADDIVDLSRQDEVLRSNEQPGGDIILDSLGLTTSV
jgi:hypothetical protein